MTGGARRLRQRRVGELKGTGTVVLAVACALGAGAGCRRDTTVGAPDSFLLVAPVPPRDGAATATKSKAGLPVVAKVPIDDPHAVPLHQKFAVGFASEVLRTDYLAKQLIRELVVNGHRYSDGQRASAREPTVLIMGGPRAGGPTSRGIALKGSFGGEDEYADVLAAAIDAYPDHDRALSQTLAGTLGLLAASRVAAADAPDPTQPLVVAYARALEVIAREWRDGEGPAGMLPPDAGSAAQRDLFAAVRENRYTLGADGAPRPARELLADPNVAATVLYRLAQSKTVGRKIAPEAVYAPFVKDRVPEGISPAAVLGPFRNFQAKLLSAWGGPSWKETRPRTSPTSSRRTGARCRASARRSRESSW